MLEMLLIVLFFLSSRFAEYAVLAIIVIYGAWSIYMKTHRPDTWLAIQEAEDRRRASVIGAIARGSLELGHRISVWLETAQTDRLPAPPLIDVRTIRSSESGEGAHLVIIDHSDVKG